MTAVKFPSIKITGKNGIVLYVMSLVATSSVKSSTLTYAAQSDPLLYILAEVQLASSGHMAEKGKRNFNAPSDNCV